MKRIMPLGAGELVTLTCPTHGTEYKGRQGDRPGAGCLECIREEGKAEADAIAMECEKRRRRSLVEEFGHAGIPPRFLRHGFSTYSIEHDGQRRAHARVQQFAERFAEELAAGRGLLMVGGTGTGKTHLAAAAAKAVMKSGYQVLMTTVLQALLKVKESYRKDSDLSERQAIARFCEPDLLILDEVGVQHLSHAERVIMTSLLDERYQQLRPTVLLSNYPVEGGEINLETILGKRVISRLREAADFIQCEWEDHRARAA